jgi:hypothetical protein
MSTKSKASKTTSGCCKRKATLNITFEWDMDVFPPAWVFPDWSSRYVSDLFQRLKRRLNIKSEASQECKDRALIIIMEKMYASMYLGFNKWKASATQQQRNLFEVGGTLLPLPFTPYDLIVFKTESKQWNFELECCDEKNGVRIITDFASFPGITGYKAKKDWSGGLPGWDGPSLNPPVKGEPLT